MREHSGSRHPQGHRELGRGAHHPLGRRLHRGRPDLGRHIGQAAGGNQPQEHPVCDQAPDRPALQGRGGQEGKRTCPLLDNRGEKRRCLGGSQRQEDIPAGNILADFAQAQGRRRELPGGRKGNRGGNHGAGLLQRFAAAGDQGRRQDRRARGQAHHQRADRGGDGLRPGEKGRRAQDRGLRPGRRHLRHIDHRDSVRGRGHPVRGPGHQRRHLPGRRGLRPEDHRLPGRRVQAVERRRPDQGHPRLAAAQGSGGKGENRAVVKHPDRHQPSLYHRRQQRPQAPDGEADPGKAGKPDRRPGRAHLRSLQDRAQGRENRQGRRRDSGRRHDPHAVRPEEGAGIVRNRAAQGRQPRRSGRSRRGRAGGGAARRRQGRPAA